MTSQWKTLKRPAESMVGAFRAESTDQWTAGSGITAKIPPLFDGSSSWFEYEELIDDWLDLTVLEAGKRGPALKNSLVGDAEMHKGLFDREPLRAEDGVKYFRAVHPGKKRKHRDGQVDRQVLTTPEALERCLDGHVTAVHRERRAKTKPSISRT